ncbi:hypothetical protein GCM10010405_50420 [Streptomyces macrosporus]|uniref:Uncharacterized protein n=1 Tax=Streptomyces macrosporus TaxID=44032 RepID=A0ABP5XR14_9ACTN
MAYNMERPRKGGGITVQVKWRADGKHTDPVQTESFGNRETGTRPSNSSAWSTLAAGTGRGPARVEVSRMNSMQRASSWSEPLRDRWRLDGLPPTAGGGRC